MRFNVSLVVCFCALPVLFFSLPAIAQFGIASRTSNTTLLIDEVPGPIGSMQVESAFPALTGQFSSPMGVFESPDASGRLFVMLRGGVIRVFPKASATIGNLSTFMDISGQVLTGGEYGLLGMAFHPDYASNGEVYLYYTTNGPNRSVISRFTNNNPADNTLPSASEEIILELNQIGSNHNGGSIEFGPDGMLYIGFGDGGGSDSSRANGQDTTNLHGNVLRIDVDSTPSNPGVQNYVVPPDNPFVGGTGPDPSTREEIYAYGFRNPYRFAFDQMDGTLFLADVGESYREETNVIVSGGNYGWPIMEGSTCFNTNNEGSPLGSCDQTGLILPIDERQYSSEAIAMLAGYRYYGSDVPELYGYYIYADYVTGNIWALQYASGTVSNQQLLANVPGLTLQSLGTDSDGEVYLCNASTNELSVIRPTGSPPPSSFPTALSDIPALLAAGLGTDQTAAGIIPYAPQTELWSDGAIKERFIAIPGTDQIGYTNTGGWDFPADTVLIKNFSLPQDFQDPINSAKRIETRLMVFNGGQWHGFSFEWNDAETDANLLTTSKDRAFNLLDDTGTPFNYSWHYPSRSECFQCHTTASNRVLGLNTVQMNHDFLFPDSGITDNQLETYDHISLFDSALPDVPANLPSSPDAFSSGASVQDRVLSYLQANCAMCHQPGGTAPTSIDLLWDVPLASRNIIGARPNAGGLMLPDPRVVAPGAPGSSVLLSRINRLDSHRMPPLASSLIHQDAVDLVTEWIANSDDYFIFAAAGDNLCLSLPGSFGVHATTPNYQWYKETDMSTILSTTNQLCFTDLQFSQGGVYILSYNNASGTPTTYEVTLIVSAVMSTGEWMELVLIASFLLCAAALLKRRKSISTNL